MVTPVQYTFLLWAMILGWLFFGDVPRPAVLWGGAVIVLTGLVIFARQRATRQN